MTPPVSRGGERGFTLVELLVTLMITVVGMVGMLGVFAGTSRGNLDARQYAEALGVCEATVEELKSKTIAELEAIAGYGPIDTTGWGPVPYDGGDATGTTGITFIREVQARAIDPDLVWLKVTVQWNTEGQALGTGGGVNDRQLGLELVRSRSEGPPAP